MENSQTKPKKEKRKSLTKSMQRLVFGVAIIILIVASFLNGKVSDNVYSQMSDTTSEQVMTSIKAVADIVGGFEEYASEVVQTWEGLPEELRNRQNDPEYRAVFDHYEEGGYARELSTALEKLQNDTFYGDMYIAAVNRETGVILYLLDPDNILMKSK